MGPPRVRRGSDPRGGYQKQRILDDRDRAERFYGAAAENRDLRREDARMQGQIRNIGSQLQQILGDVGVALPGAPADDFDDSLNSSLHDLQRRLGGPGRGSRQQGQLRVGGALRPRVSPAIWNRPSSAPPGGYAQGGYGGGGYARTLPPGPLPPADAGYPGSPYGSLAASQHIPPTPATVYPQTPAMPHAPHDQRPSSPAPKSKVSDEVLQKLRLAKDDALEQNKKLMKEISEVLEERQKGGTKIEDKARSDQLKEKDHQYQKLEAEGKEARVAAEKKADELQRQLKELHQTKIDKQIQIRSILAGGSGKGASKDLEQKIAAAEKEQESLERRQKDLMKNHFISQTSSRNQMGEQVAEKEKNLAEEEKKYKKIFDDHAASQSKNAAATRKRTDLQNKCKDLLEENTKFRMRLEEKDRLIDKVQSQLRFMQDNVGEGERDALERALSVIVGSAPAAYSRIDVIDRDVGAVPSSLDMRSTDAMGKILGKLEKERDDLKVERDALRKKVQYEASVNKDLRAFNLEQIDDCKRQENAIISDKDKWERVARSRESRVTELRKQLEAFEKPADVRTGPAFDAASSAGFTDLSELPGHENAMDVYLTMGRIEASALLRVGDSQLTATTCMAVVCVEFYEFAVGYSQVASGQQPRFDSLISFGPFQIDDFLIEHLRRGAVRFELRVFALGSEKQHVVGRCTQALSPFLAESLDRSNPIVAGTAKFADQDDPNLSVAWVDFKMRLRYPIGDLLDDYQRKVDVYKIDTEVRPADYDLTLPDTTRTLLVQIFSVAGLVAPRGKNVDILRPYVYYQLPGQPEHFTATASGGACRFDDSNRLLLSIDAGFRQWVEFAGGLHVVVFNDTPDWESVATDNDSADILGEVKVSLKPLLRDALANVHGTYTMWKDLTDPGAAAAGTIEVSIRWQELAVGGTTAMARTEDLHILTFRINLRLAEGKVSAENAFKCLDVMAGGKPTRSDVQAGLLKLPFPPPRIGLLPLGLSLEETIKLSEKLDKEGVGHITLNSFLEALKLGDCAARLEAWAKPIFERVARGMPSVEVLKVKPPPYQKDFEALVERAVTTTTPGELDKLWLLVDKNEDGTLDLIRFVKRFGPKPGDEKKDEKKPTTRATVADAQVKLLERQFNSCMGRILRNLSKIGVKSAEAAFDHFDKRKDGALLKAEFIEALSLMDLGLSLQDCEMIFSQLDADGDGYLLMEEWRQAVRRCTQDDWPQKQQEAWAKAILDRIRKVIDRKGKQLESIFRDLSDPTTKVMDKSRFCNLILRFEATLDGESLDKIWEMLPKDRDGNFGYKEFAETFSQATMILDSAKQETMADEYLAILMGRLRRKLIDQGVGTLEEALKVFDYDGDGQLTARELEYAIFEMNMNLSQAERAELVRRVDLDGNGIITLQELQTAFQLGEAVSTPVEKKAAEVFALVRDTIKASPHSAKDVFKSLCKGRTTMREADFRELLTSFSPGILADEVKRMWQICDKNNDGELQFNEFERYFTDPKPGEKPPLEPKRPPALDVVPVSDGTLAPKPVAAKPGEQDNFDILCSRIRKRLDITGSNVAAAFKAYDKDKSGSLDREEFINGLLSLRLGVSKRECAELYSRMEGSAKNAVTLEEFTSTLQGGVRASANEDWAKGVMQKIRDSIGRSSRPPQELFQHFCFSGGRTMNQDDFIQVISTFEPTSKMEDMSKLWYMLDKDEEGCISFAVFSENMCPRTSAVTPTPQPVTDERKFLIYLMRFDKGLTERGQSAAKVLILFDDGAGGVTLPNFMKAANQNGIMLSRTEIEIIFFRFTQEQKENKRLLTEHLEGALKQMPKSLPEEEFVKTFVTDVNNKAMRTGTSLETGFAALARDAIPVEDMKAEFLKYTNMDDNQWNIVSLLADKQQDGKILWRPFLRWACKSGVVGGALASTLPPPPPGGGATPLPPPGAQTLPAPGVYQPGVTPLGVVHQPGVASPAVATAVASPATAFARPAVGVASPLATPATASAVGSPLASPARPGLATASAVASPATVRPGIATASAVASPATASAVARPAVGTSYGASYQPRTASALASPARTSISGAQPATASASSASLARPGLGLSSAQPATATATSSSTGLGLAKVGSHSASPAVASPARTGLGLSSASSSASSVRPAATASATPATASALARPATATATPATASAVRATPATASAVAKPATAVATPATASAVRATATAAPATASAVRATPATASAVAKPATAVATPATASAVRATPATATATATARPLGTATATAAAARPLGTATATAVAAKPAGSPGSSSASGLRR